VHEQADREHGGGALEIVANLARTDEEQQQVRDIVRNTLELLWRFFDDWQLLRWSRSPEKRHRHTKFTHRRAAAVCPAKASNDRTDRQESAPDYILSCPQPADIRFVT